VGFSLKSQGKHRLVRISVNSKEIKEFFDKKGRALKLGFG